MIPVRLKLSNFTSYGKHIPELDFTKFHLAVIAGPNGAGKSSLLDAITWCLWGWSRAGDSSDQLIRLGANEMWVEFSFALDGNNFTVKRRRSLKGGASSALELWSNSHNLTEGTIKTTQEKIINLLHLNYETFTNSSFLRQGHADEFTTKGPTDRKRILADILGLDHYDHLEERAKERSKANQMKLQLLEYQVLEIEAELSQREEKEQQLKQSQKRVLEIENKIRLQERELKLMQKEREILMLREEQRKKLEQNFIEGGYELQKIIEQGRKRSERIKNLERRIMDLEQVKEKVKELKKIEKEVESLRMSKQKSLELQRQITEINGDLKLKINQKQILDKEIQSFQDQIKKLSVPGAKCPTCGQEINFDQRHQVLMDLKKKLKDKIAEVSKISTATEARQLKILNQQLASISFDEDRLEKLEKDLQVLENLQKQKEELLQDKATLENEKRVREELLILYKDKKSQIEKLEEDLKKLTPRERDYSLISQNIIQKEEGLETLRAEEKQAQSILGQAKELISRAAQMEKLKKQKEEEKLALQKEKDIFDELALAFGKKGIQAMIIETAIPEIEDEANSLLDKLTNGRMKVHFETQRETKTKLESGEKGIIETLDIIISDEMGEREYSLYSGGETFRVNLAIRLAISKLLTRRAGAKLQFLVIDEGFGTQDQEGRTRIVEVLDTIKNDFEKILVITHLEELKEEFPIRIEVAKNSLGSTFEVVGV